MNTNIRFSNRPSLRSVRAAWVVTFALALGMTPGALASSDANPAAQPTQVEKIVQQYILDHPEVVLESIRRFSERQKVAEQERKQSSIGQHQDDLYRDAASPSAEAAPADKDAVTVVEFFDYRCGYCRKVEDTVSRFAGKPGVRVVYKELPILGPDSLLAAEAALAAQKQGGYQKFHHALLTAQAPLTATSIEQIAAAAGLDVAKLKTDMNSPDIKAEIARNSALASALGVQATPTFVAATKIVSGAMSPEEFEKFLENARAGAANLSAQPKSNAQAKQGY